MSGLEEEFPGKVKAQNLDATTDEAKKDIEALGFRNHGLVIRSPEGEVLHKQPDHTTDIAKARMALEEIVKRKE